ncbi:hypothetical protein LSAT2_007899 [Lamellibrachia satsuma]|nr:hypothetical protein LSAT2_007899 [Lamellibrachia satsuma]
MRACVTDPGTNFGPSPIYKSFRRHCITYTDEACWLWRYGSQRGLSKLLVVEARQSMRSLQAAVSVVAQAAGYYLRLRN